VRGYFVNEFLSRLLVNVNFCCFKYIDYDISEPNANSMYCFVGHGLQVDACGGGCL